MTIPENDVLIFDVNETLLDLKVLDPVFERTFGQASIRGLWFSQMLQLSFVGAITNQYVSFTEAQHGALRMLAQRFQTNLSDSSAREIVGTMSVLPAHSDVRSGLSRLRQGGYRLASLTNSPLDVVEAQLANAGLRDLLEAVISADEVRRLKPAAEAYRYAADRMGVPLKRMWLVAAHAWDVSGAMAAGARAVFVARPGMVVSPLGAQPDVIVPDVKGLADLVLST